MEEALQRVCVQANQQREVPRQFTGHKGMDKEGSSPQVARPAGNPAAQAERLAELLRSERELANDSALLLRGRILDIQVAESKESATFDDMGTVHRPLEAMANASSQNSGETVTGKGL